MTESVRLLAATENKNKIYEIQSYLKPLGITVITPSELNLVCDVEETGITFLENAEIKARYMFDKTGIPAFADDSGLCVDALGGAPGLYSARYGGAEMPAGEKNQMLLKEMADIPIGERTARFVTAIYCVWSKDKAFSCQGVCEGKISFSPAGSDGFGYDPIFQVGDKTFAQLSTEEKNAMSHRGKALKKFVDMLEEIIPNRKR